MPNPNPQHNPTDGLGVAAYVQVTGTGVTANQTTAAGKPNPGNYKLTLSLGGTSTCQLTPVIVDAKDNVYPGSLVLSAVANASGSTSVYTGTITGGGSNAFAGMTVTVAGFSTSANNGTFLVTASSTTTLTLANAAGVAETHAATANAQVGTAKYFSYNDPNAGTPAWYNPSNAPQGPYSTNSAYAPNVASVSSSGLITGLAIGQAIIEVAFPTFDNTIGTDSQGEGEPDNFIYTQIVVTVTA